MQGAARGFTLLEILIVMVIAGLIAGVALPNLQRLAAQVSHNTERAALLADIDRLGYRAFSTGFAFQLSTEHVIDKLGDGAPALQVPADWGVRLPRPISYTLSGFCDGGTIELTAPDRTLEVVTLMPPRCKVRPGDA